MLVTLKKWRQGWESEELCQQAVSQWFSACDVVHHRPVHGFQEGAKVQKSGVSQLQGVVLLFGFNIPLEVLHSPSQGSLTKHYCPITVAARKETMPFEKPLS